MFNLDQIINPARPEIPPKHCIDDVVLQSYVSFSDWLLLGYDILRAISQRLKRVPEKLRKWNLMGPVFSEVSRAREEFSRETVMYCRLGWVAGSLDWY